MSFIASRRLAPAAPCRVGDNDEQGQDSGLSKRFGDITFYLICAGTVALIGTSIRVWAGMTVIETRIGQLVQSDNQQNAEIKNNRLAAEQKIEQVRSEVNNLRVQLGIVRAIQGSPPGLGRP